MTLAEAIAHEDWAANTAHGELADEHAQMRDWLRELERMRSARDVWQENDARLREELDAAKHDLSVFSGEIVASKAENAKLREYVTWLEEAVIERGYVPSQTKTWLDAKRFELGIEVSA